MANIPKSLVPTGRAHIQGIKWEAMGNADTGEWVEMSSLQDRTVHLGGTWGSATIVIQGSNFADKSLPITLRDPAGNNLSFTADGLKAILELPRWIRPVSSGGTGTDVDVIINARGDNS